MTTKIYTKIDQELIKAWETLWSKAPNANYTNGPQWFMSVLQTFNPKEWVLIALFEKDALVGIGALVKEKRYGIPVYTVALNDFVCGMPFLLDATNKNHVKTFLDEVEKLGTCYFDNIPENLKEIIKKEVPTTDISETALNYFFQFTYDEKGLLTIPNRKKMLHRIRDNQASFTLKPLDGTDPEGLKTVFEVDALSRKQGRGYNAFSDETIREFYLSLAEHFQKHFRVNILYFEKTPIAYEIGFSVGTTYYGNQIAFIGEYAHYSPGKVLVIKQLDYLSTMKFEKLDFGSGDSHIKRLLTEDYQKLYQVVISQNSFIRIYLKKVRELNTTLFLTLQKHITIYSLYKKITKSLKP